MVIGFDKNRDFIDVLISRIFARARARASARTNKKRARARARAREIEEKISILVILREGKQTDFNYFTSGCTDRF